jgi:hypothetical protein
LFVTFGPENVLTFPVAPQDHGAANADATKDSDPLFRFLSWGDLDPERSKYLRDNFLPVLPPSINQCAALRFYKTFGLLRVTDLSTTQSGARFPRAYALYRWGDDDALSIVRPLDGTSLPIHEINRIPGELNLVEDTADEYLRFFCSAVHSQDGPFLILDENNYEVVVGDNTAVSEALKREFQLGIRSEADPELEGEFARLSNPFPRSSIKRRKACVFYSSALFRAWFVIDDSPQNPGMVQMVDDEPILTGLKVNIPRYSDGSLFVLSVLIEKEPPRIPPVPSDEKAKASDKESKPTHYFSRKQSDTERDEVDKLLKNFTRNHTGPGTIESEVVFASNRT